MRTTRKLIISILLSGAILLIISGFYWMYSTTKPDLTGLEQAFNPSGDFTLTDYNRKIFHLRECRGKAVLLFFGYTSCPGICPMTLSKLARTRTLLGAAGQKVVTVFVTVDPEHDTTARLKEYLGHFDINAVGLTGTKTQIDDAVHAYHAYYQKMPIRNALGYTINHTTIVYLIDKDGKVRHLFHQDDSPENISKVIRENCSGT